MPTIIRHPTREHPRGNQRRPPSPRPTPPPVTINPKTESLDRRIRNLEALGNGVFIGNVLASYMALPGLVGFWPMSSIQRSTGNAYDLSGQGRTLTYNGNPAYTYDNGLVPYIAFDGTGDYLSRADETDLDITGAETIYTTGAAGLTMGGWFWLDSTASEWGLIGKWNGTGNQRSYVLTSSATPRLYVSGNGSTQISVDSSVTVSTGTWYFMVARFIASTSIDIYINSTKTTNTASIPASLFVSTATFEISGYSAGTAVLLPGRATLCFLCANALGDDLISSLFQSSRVLLSV